MGSFIGRTGAMLFTVMLLSLRHAIFAEDAPDNPAADPQLVSGDSVLVYFSAQDEQLFRRNVDAAIAQARQSSGATDRSLVTPPLQGTLVAHESGHERLLFMGNRANTVFYALADDVTTGTSLLQLAESHGRVAAEDYTPMHCLDRFAIYIVDGGGVSRLVWSQCALGLTPESDLPKRGTLEDGPAARLLRALRTAFPTDTPNREMDHSLRVAIDGDRMRLVRD
ncbi:hypothetical protein GC173_12420 [bacterium]|nr:hypothetical protein [bacterium]